VTDTVKYAEIRRIEGRTSGFELVLDGVVFPWHIERQDVEVTDLFNDDTMHVLRIGIIIDGPVIGAEAFNEYLAEESDRSRVWRADYRDMLNEGYPLLV
jgi:hypothetical protein